MVSLLTPQPSSSSGASSVSNLSRTRVEKPPIICARLPWREKKAPVFWGTVSHKILWLQSSSPGEPPSPPRWTAPRRRKSENFYEQCTRDDNNSVRDREEALYSMPEAATPPAVTTRTSSKGKAASPVSSHSSCPTPSTEITRLSRFTQHEHEKIQQKRYNLSDEKASLSFRGGVRKRLEKSFGPPLEKSSSMVSPVPHEMRVCSGKSGQFIIFNNRPSNIS